MANDETPDDADATEGITEAALPRRALLLSVLAGGTLAGFGGGYLLFRDDPSLSLTVDAPTAVVAGMRADAPEPIVIPGDAIALEVAYSGFHDGLVGGDLEPGAFDVTVAARPAFADAFEPLATGSLDAGATPGDTVTATLESGAFEPDVLELAAHGAVSDDYAEFAPEGDEPAETDVDLEVTVESESYDVTASRTRTMTVTVTRLVDVTVDVDALRASFDVAVDGGEIDAMTIAGADVPIDLSYDGFGADVANREDEFTVTVLVRPAFDDGLEELATRSLDAGETPADTVSGAVSDEPISLAGHSAIPSTFAPFEPDNEVQTTDLEVEVRVESATYGVTVAERIDFSVTVEEDDVTVTTVSRTRRPPTPAPDLDPEIGVGGRLVLEGEAANEPHDQP